MTSSWPRSAGCTGSTPSGFTAPSTTSRPSSSRPPIITNRTPTSRLESNELSLHQTQGVSLTHWAPPLGTTVKPLVGPGVLDVGSGYPGISDGPHTLPGEAGALAATLQRALPEPCHLEPEPAHCLAVGRYRVVREVAAHHASQPCCLDGDGQVDAALYRKFELPKLVPHPFGYRVTPQEELAVPGGRADVHEPQEREGLGFPQTTPAPGVGGEPSELDQPGLFLRQLQAKLRKPLPKIVRKASGVTFVLEPDDHVIREPQDDHVAVGVPVPPRLGPQVEHIMQVHVREQRRK